MSRYVIIGILTFSTVWFLFFRSNDEKYIKQTTLEMIDLMAEPVSTSKMTTVLRRIRDIADPMHFSILIVVSDPNKEILKNESLSQVKSLLGHYFKNQPQFQMKKLDLDDLEFSMKENGDKKSAHLSFVLQGGSKEKVYSCQVLMEWKYDKEWKVYKIEGSNCKNLNVYR